VKATAPGFVDATQSVQLTEGGSAGVTLTLKPDANAVAPVPAPVAAPTGAPPPAPAPDVTRSGGSKTLPIILLAAGGVGLAVGSVFGVMALGTKSSLDSACSGKVCPQSSQSDIDSLGTQATISTIGFGVGIVGAALGVYFLVTSGRGGETAGAATARSAPARSLDVQPWIGLGSAGLGGTFQ